MATHLGVNGLLHVVGLLDRTPAQQAVGNRIILIGQHRAVLHHVRILFGLEQIAFVGDDDNGFHQIAVLIGHRIIGEQVSDFLVLFQILQIFAGYQTVVRQETNLVALVLADFLRRLQIGVLASGLDVHFAVDPALHALNHLVD